MTFKATHFKFAITESPTIEPVAAPVVNGGLAVAAFIVVCRDMAAIMTLHYISKCSAFAARRGTAAQHLLMMVKKGGANKSIHAGSDESVTFGQILRIHENTEKETTICTQSCGKNPKIIQKKYPITPPLTVTASPRSNQQAVSFT